MKFSFLQTLALVLASFVGGASLVSAGIVYTMETISDKGKPSTMKVQAQDDRVKMTYEGQDANDEFVIFDGGNKTLLVGDPSKKSYLVLDRATLDGIREMISEAQRQMEQALAQIPEAQRAQMKEMMASRMPGMGTDDKPTLDVKATGESKEIEGYDTKSHEVLINGRKQSELWVTPWDRIEGGDEVKQSIANMAEFFSAFFESMPQASGSTDEASANWIRAMESIDGFPVRSTAFDGKGSRISETTLKSIDTAKFTPSDFDVPEGYTRQSLDLP